MLKAKVKRAALSSELIGKVEVEFSSEPKKSTSKEIVLVDKLLTRLKLKAKNKKILLIVDEVQHLAALQPSIASFCWYSHFLARNVLPGTVYIKLIKAG